MGLFSKRGSKRRTNKDAKKSSRGTKPKSKGTEKSNEKKSANAKYSKRRSSRQKASANTPRGSSNTKSKSHAPTPDKERDGKKREKRSDEREQDSVGKDDKSRGSQVILPINNQAKPRRVRIGSREVDDETVERVYEKFTKERKEPGQAPPPAAAPLDEKARLLMDRVKKKPIKSERSEMFYDEMSSFQKKKSIPGDQKIPDKMQEKSVFFDDDSYSQVPKLINVRKMEGENVYTEKGVPYWADPLEPNEEEQKTTDEAIQVSNEHIEMVHNKTIKMIKNPEMNLELNEFLHLSDLVKRDGEYFDNRLVFSNTIRTFMLLDPGEELKKLKKHMEELIESPKNKKVRFNVEDPIVAVLYSRADPIQSIREICSSRVPVTTTLSLTTSTSSRDENN